HAERNPAAWSPCRYLEMWVLPEAAGLDPGVEVADVSRLRTANGLVRVASGAGHPGAVTLTQPGAVLWAGRLGPGEPAEVPVWPTNPTTWPAMTFWPTGTLTFDWWP